MSMLGRVLSRIASLEVEHVVGMVLLSFRVAVPAARNMESPGEGRDN